MKYISIIKNTGNDGATVVYNNYLENGNAKQISPDVQQYLLSGRIKTVRTRLMCSDIWCAACLTMSSNNMVITIGGIGTPAPWRLPDSHSEWCHHCHHS